MGITERIDAITPIPHAWRAAAPSCPRSVKIELTARCSFACAFCARSARLRAQKDIDRGFYARIVREMAEAGVEELGMFYLGESCLVPWLPEAIVYAKEISTDYVFLTTNGSLTAPKKVRTYMAAGLDSLKFSYNYADADQFTQIAQVKPAYFDAMIRNLKAAWRIREDGGYPMRPVCLLHRL
jgi:MoaA/NifB/PqqE/SkfB family radical SAM enzyme